MINPHLDQPIPPLIQPLQFIPVPYSQIDYSLPEYQYTANDMGVAKMIAAVMNGDLIYIIEQGAFFKWNGKI